MQTSSAPAESTAKPQAHAASPNLLVEKDPRYVRVLLDGPEIDRVRGLLDDVDRAFEDPAWLKKGTASSVIRTQVDGKDFVYKRYNLKSLYRRIKALFRPNRAGRCFRFGRALREIGVNTPRPLGYQQMRRGIVRSHSYLVFDFVEGPDYLEYLSRPSVDWRAAATELANRLNKMWLAGFTHGDLKATNILLASDGAHLVDLDSIKRLRGTWLAIDVRKDQKRLLKNWSDNPELTAFLTERLVDPRDCARARPNLSYFEPIAAWFKRLTR